MLDIQKRRASWRKAAKVQRLKNGDILRERCKKWALEHPERMKELKKKWSLKHLAYTTYWRHHKRLMTPMEMFPFLKDLQSIK